MNEPDAERIQNALKTIVDELGDVNHVEINHYKLNNGERYTNLYCPEGIPGLEDSPQNKYQISQITIEDKTAATLVPLTE